MSRLRASFLLFTLALVVSAMPASAVVLQCPLLQSGDDERVDGVDPCAQESDFVVGTSSSSPSLQVGGEAYGCDSEWAASFEFDLSGVPSDPPLLSATLVVRKTGYADDAQGFFYVGSFFYDADGTEQAMPRAALSPQTATDVLYPPAANVDLSFDVTAALAEWISNERTRGGLLLAGVYSEAGYEDWISVAGLGSTYEPRLLVELEGTVPLETPSWSNVKGRFRP